MPFQVGDLVKCVDLSDYPPGSNGLSPNPHIEETLTLGGQYYIIGKMEKRVRVCVDASENGWYWESRFELIRRANEI